MLHKFERYISKNIPQNALTSIEKKVLASPHNYQGLPADNKAFYNWVGWQQRNNIEPKKFSLAENKEKIGRVIRQEQDKTAYGNVPTIHTEQASKRKVLLYQGGVNHMQSTGYCRRDYWYMQWESIGSYRSHGMHWGRCSDDPWRSWGNRYDIPMANMDQAVEYARKFGYEVDVIYPHQRYHTQKAYADNFNFVKEALSDIEDEEEVVFDIMNKLV